MPDENLTTAQRSIGRLRQIGNQSVPGLGDFSLGEDGAILFKPAPTDNYTTYKEAQARLEYREISEEEALAMLTKVIEEQRAHLAADPAYNPWPVNSGPWRDYQDTLRRNGVIGDTE